MNENISRLMDGELAEGELDAVCTGLRHPEAMVTWTCYHVIGDALRGSDVLPAGCAARLAQRLAGEPTVLAPAPRRSGANAATWAWAAAATVAAVAVVGWTALSVVSDPTVTVAKSRTGGTVGQARVRPGAIPADYLLAHQEYSTAAAAQVLAPYLHAVATPATGERP